MSTVPANRCIYHITHVDNLPSIVSAGGLFSDATMRIGDRQNSSIGMSEIKRRRLTLPVRCNPGTNVGDYVPFYFCPRSVMLYVLHCGNHPDLEYKAGQAPIIHLEAALSATIAWANKHSSRWAFSFSNAGAYYADFNCDPSKLDQLNWAAIGSTGFRDPAIKEAKQAEFLVHEHFPWALVDRVGVFNRQVYNQVSQAISGATHKPRVEILPQWYY